MHYFLRQVLPPKPGCANDPDPPIEIHFYRDEVTVGRRQFKCLSIFPQVSRDHAVFYKSEDGSILVKDNNSLNGVFVNGARIGSSLKVLHAGDVIGFGVVHSDPDGFVCVLCSDDIKIEEIEISDEDATESPKPDSKLSDMGISVQPESGKSRCQTSRDETCSDNDVSLPESSGIRRASVPQDGALNICKVEPSGSSSPAKSKFPGFINKNLNSPESSRIKSVSEPQDGALNIRCQVEPGGSSSRARNEVTLYNNNVVNFPEFRGNKSTSESRNGVKNIQHTTFCKVEKRKVISGTHARNGKSINRKTSPDIMSVRRCFVPLVRCDDSSFLFPPDVKNPFHEHSDPITYPLKHKRKHPRILSSESSDDCAEKVYPSTSRTLLKVDSVFSNKHRRKNIRNLSTDSSDDCAEKVHPSTSRTHLKVDSVFSNKDGSECQTHTANLAGDRKRKISDNPEEPNCAPSSSTKKPENSHRGIADNSETEAKSSIGNQDGNMEGSYSQVDNIIYISDDDSYLDFQSSQNWVRIKQEPVDSDSDTYKEIFERDSNYADNCHPSPMSVQSQEVESIESILAFVAGPNNNISNITKSDSRSPVHTIQINKSVFPFPSQDALSESSSEYESDVSDNKMRDSRIEKSTDENQTCNKLTENKNIRKSSGKTLLTEAKPLTYKPKRLRGRDESFVEKKKAPASVVTKTPARKQKKILRSANDTNLCESTNSENFRNTRFDDRDYPVPGKRRISHLSRPIENAVKNNAATCPESQSGSGSSRRDASARVGEIYKAIEPARSQSDPRTNPSSGHNSRPSAVVLEGVSHNPAKNARQTAAVPVNKPVHPPSSERVPAQCISPSFNRPAGTPVQSNRRTSEPSNKSWPSVPERALPSPKSNPSLPQISFDGVMKAFLQMNTKWLQEQTRMKCPPPDVSKGAADLPTTYKHYDSYASSFYPMIMLEIWEQMYRESKEMYGKNKQDKLFYFAVRSYTAKQDCVELKCESVVNERVCFGPREGVMAVLELKESSRRCSPLFGYIFRHKIASLQPGTLKESPWKNLPEAWTSNAKHWTFYTRIKKKDTSFELNILMRGYGLCYIRSKLRLADALRSFRDSPLQRDILAPRESAFATSPFLSPPTREYSSAQTKLIKCFSREMLTPQPKIVLLRGPSGTGKTHVIIGLLEEVFHCGQSDTKVLVTAPSDVAVDEIGCRLSGFRKQQSGVRIVRVGLEKQVDPRMLPYFVSNVAKETYWRSPQYAESRERKRQTLLSEINKLQMGKGEEGRIEFLKDRCRQLQQNSLGVDYDSAKYEVRALQESHIILSTLNNCSLSLFQRSFRSNAGVRPTFCVVDDAAHCTELEALQPLMLGVDRLVLVGDPLISGPTVLSRVASNCGYGTSMFERLLSHFRDSDAPHTLTDQFRMHPAICDFPGRHFYDRKLFTHPEIHLRYKDFPLNPYVVLDLSALRYTERTTDLSAHSALAETEASVVWQVCQFLDLAGQRASVGVIVPDLAKRSFHARKIRAQPFGRRVEVHTVDWFRGREKDVILLLAAQPAAAGQSDAVSFLSCSKQLTVALTRARKCLIVCVNEAKLTAYPHWKSLILDAQQRNLWVSVSSPRDALENHVFRRSQS